MVAGVRPSDAAAMALRVASLILGLLVVLVTALMDWGSTTTLLMLFVGVAVFSAMQAVRIERSETGKGDGA